MSRWWIFLALGISSAVAGYELTDTYIPRLSDHGGFELVEVPDAVAMPPASRPRHILFVVIDGLRHDYAGRMTSLASLRERGACYDTFTGVPSVSRPVYAVYSTGLEQDRTGARNNDTGDRMRARSVWQQARESGRVVAARSGVPWWQELFPDGFDSYDVVKNDENAFPTGLTADITLVHPTYLDDIAHEHGVASEYSAAVERVDGELAAALAALDLNVDAVVVTADHGHRDSGGHGGDADIVTRVVTCMAGHGITRTGGDGSPPPTLRATFIGPFLSVLLGVPFPSHMRAQDDDLDQLWTVLDARVLGEKYAADRRTAVENFRTENARYLRHVGDPSWSARQSWGVWWRTGLFAGLASIGVMLACATFSRRRSTVLLALLGFAVGLGAELGAYTLFSGGLDGSSVSNRSFFLRNALLAAVVASAVLTLLGYTVGGRRKADKRDAITRLVATQTVALAAVSIAHIVAFGWPLGYPVPSPLLYFAPFWLSIYWMVSGVWLAAIAGFSLWEERRAQRPPRPQQPPPSQRQEAEPSGPPQTSPGTEQR